MGHHESGSESVFSGFESFGSSSFSDLSTLVGSELDSTEVESDDEDYEFMAELTRQMADYMLQEDEDDNNNIKDKEEEQVAADCNSENFKDTDGLQGINDSSVISSPVKEPNTSAFHSTLAFTSDQMPRVQFYQLEDQPRVVNNGSMSLGRRGKRTESTQHEKKQDHKQNNLGRANEMGNYGKAYPYGGGSGMRAVFLGGNGSRNASSGTGVFLPRPLPISTNTPDQPRKKSGCSTVLIPTRVLQALEQHFSNMESSSPSNAHPALHERRDNIQEKRQTKSQSQLRAAVDHQVSQLPPEWTY